MLDSFWGRWQTTAGLVLVLSAALAGLFAGCGGKGEPETAEVKKFRPVDDSEPSAATSAAAEPTEAATEAAAASRRAVPAAFAAATEPPPAAGGNAKSNEAPAQRAAAPPSAGGGKISAELQPILEQLDRLSRQQPKGNSEREQVEDLIRIHTQRLTLAKKALGLKPDVEMKRRIVMAIYEILQVFMQARVPSAMTQLAEFAKTMSADADPEVARIGRHAQFSASFARIASRPLEDGQELVAEAKKLIEPERGNLNEATLQLLIDVANNLTESGFANDAAAIFESMAEALAADSKLADQAPRLALEAKMLRIDLNTLLNNVIRAKPEALEKIEAAVQALLKEAPPSRELLNRTQMVAHILESTGHHPAAQSTFDQIAAAFSETSDAAIAESVKNLSAKAKLRMGLIGQPFTVEGVMVDGSPFDWSAYAGKVVLVDFWATWCGPCLEEMPNIRQNFEQFHAKGFEVVGVNLDLNVADLKQFLMLQDVPWATVTSQVVLGGQVQDGNWSELPMAAKCGVQSIPFVVLVGKDGKVDSIHVRGSKLRSRLSELLGDPITTEIPADPTQPGAKAKADAGKQSNAMPRRGGRESIAANGHRHGRMISAIDSRPLVAATPVALLMAQALFAADPPAAVDESVNPYRAKPDLTASQLVAFVQKMLDRPQAIQMRAGFADAIVEACDRVLAASPPATQSEQLAAIESKFAVLHREACDGKEAADKQLLEFAEQLKSDAWPAVAREVEFFRLERRVIDAKELPVEEIPALLKDVQAYVAKEKLTGKHVRLASSTTAVINRLENGDEREAHFATFGKLFAKSSDKELVRYGKKLAKKPAAQEAAESR